MFGFAWPLDLLMLLAIADLVVGLVFVRRMAAAARARDWSAVDRWSRRALSLALPVNQAMLAFTRTRPALQVTRATAQWALGRGRDAEALLRAALRRPAKTETIRNARGILWQIRLEAGDIAGALLEADRLDAEVPGEPSADRMRVLTLGEAGRWAEAEAALARMPAGPHRADAEGRLALMRGDWERALRSTSSREGLPFTGAARAELELGRPDRAFALLRAATGEDLALTDMAYFHALAAAIAAAQGMRDRAREECARARDEKARGRPFAISKALFARCLIGALLELGDAQDAARVADELPTTWPTPAALHAARAWSGRAYEAAGRAEAAARAYRDALAVGAGHAWEAMVRERIASLEGGEAN